MRTFYIIEQLDPTSGKSKGFIHRSPASYGPRAYKAVKADDATLYTTKSAAANSRNFVADKFKLPIKKYGRANYYDSRELEKNLRIVEVKALLIPSTGVLDALLTGRAP